MNNQTVNRKRKQQTTPKKKATTLANALSTLCGYKCKNG